MNENILYSKMNSINFKLNIIMFIIIVEIIFAYWLYLKAGSMLTMADILMDRAQMYGELIFKGNHR